jgi:hypothetical protein
MRAQCACFQINDPIRSIEKPGVGIPLIDCCRNSAIRARKTLHCSHSPPASDCRRDTWLIAPSSRLTANRANSIKDTECLVHSPVGSGPDHLPAPDRDIAKIADMTFGEAQSQCLV